MSRTELLLHEFASVRRYTNLGIASIRDEDWFRVPEGCPTHFAWQVGHMALAEWSLALRIPRGEQASDEHLISSAFRKQFGRGSVPQFDPADNPTVADILATFHAVHARVLEEVAGYSEELLSEPAGVEHPMFDTKFGSLMWCVQHEFTHAGQISLLRRLLGYEIRW